MPSIIVCLVGIFLCVIGVLTFRGNTFFLKKRYLRNVSEEDLPAFCFLNGISAIAEGISVMIMGILLYVFGEGSWIAIPFLILLIISAIPALIAAFKYNKR